MSSEVETSLIVNPMHRVLITVRDSSTSLRSARNDRKRARSPKPATAGIGQEVINAAQRLRDAVNKLQFGPPVTHVYNPLDYAWPAHEAYLRRYANGKKRIVFLGMNPGPFGMAQTGVPFGEIAAVRDWLGVQAPIRQPSHSHPKRPIKGFDCPRREISGQRLWKLFADRFGSAQKFSASHFVLNYCPLAFMEATGCNHTPDKVPLSEKKPLFAACDEHLREVVSVLQPEWIIGIGAFATKRAAQVFAASTSKVAGILHPSPASPAANDNWARSVTQQLVEFGVWD